MGRASGAALVLCAAGAFFLPLGVKLWRGTAAARPGRLAEVSSVAGGIADVWGRAAAAESSESRSEREPSPVGASDVAVLDFELVPDRPEPRAPARATWLNSDLPREDRPPVTPWEGLPVGDLQQLLLKLLAATAVVLGLCVVLLRWGHRFMAGGGARSATRELVLADSIAVSREAGVKLIQIGNQRVVVGHDRGGLRGMVLLPTCFDDVLSEARGEGLTDRRTPEELRGSVQAALTNPEDNGWDLNQQIS